MTSLADRHRPAPGTPTPARRSGFTLVELLVVIAIIGTLVALLLPAVQAARARAALNTCVNQARQLATAVINYESTKKHYPGYVQPLKRSKDATNPTQDQFLAVTLNTMADSRFSSVTNANSVTAQQQSLVSWAGVILPQMDSQALYDNLVDSQVTAATDARTVIPRVEFLVCPSDSELKSQGQSAGMTYVANAGAWDRNTGGAYLDPRTANVGDTKANGVFHNLTLGNVKLSSGGAIRDGAAQTAMLSENIHKEVDGQIYTWLGVPASLGGEQQYGMVWVVNTAPADGSGSLTDQVPFNTESKIVSSFPSNVPLYARPASGHATVFVVAMMDGSTRPVDVGIDYTVYQRLMTPDGRKCVDPTNHNAVGSGTEIYKFRTLPVLDSGDF